MVVQVEMLGASRVVHDEGSRPLRPTMRDQALAYLAYDGGWVSRDRLGFLFWPDSPDGVARHNVRQLLKRIRKLDGMEGLETQGETVRWAVPSDVEDLRQIIRDRRWNELSPPRELLPGMERNATVEFEEWLLGQRRHVRREWRSAAMAAAAAAEKSGHPKRAADLLDPTLDDAEESVALIRYMQLMTKAGLRTAALARYREAAEQMWTVSGTRPSDEARELADKLASEHANHVAAPDSRTVGRSEELAEIWALLSNPDCRILTLLGPGGIGKSTLARMLAEERGANYTDGAVEVALEKINDPETILSTIASELGLRLDGRVDGLDQLVTHLRDRDMLLVLDNAEHLPHGWAYISVLAARCARMSIVVTSRERMRIDGEWVYPVSGLSENEGAELFGRLTRRIASNIEVSTDVALGVSRAVAGSPLGIELAAPWVRVMNPGEIAEEIASDYGLLSGGARDGASRHDSVASAMAHSWDLATREEREAIEALAVFHAPYTRDLALQVSRTSPVVLRDLADKSLLRYHSDGRYSSHPLVRQYAAGRLSSDEIRRQRVRGRHMVAVLHLLDPPGEARKEILLVDDAVAAFRHACEIGEMRWIARSAEGLVNLLVATGRFEQGLRLMAEAKRVIDSRDGDESAFAASRLAEARLLYQVGRMHEAASTAESALDAASRAGNRRLLVLAYTELGWSRKWIAGDSAQHETIQNALPIARELGDDGLLAWVLNGLGSSAPTLEACLGYLLEGLEHASTDPEHRSVLYSNIGMVLWALEDPDRAIEYEERSLQIARAEGLSHRIANSLLNLAFIHGQAGNVDIAFRLADEATRLERDTDPTRLRIYRLVVAGETHRLAGDFAEALRHALEALRLSDDKGNVPFALRALRLRSQLLLDDGDLEAGLRLLALVVSMTAEKGGDFTSETINPRLWEDATRSAPIDAVADAQSWASAHTLEEVVVSTIDDLDSELSRLRGDSSGSH